MNDYIIIANSHFLVKEIIFEAIKNKIIIALDGAANKVAALGIKPHAILGDFDSINETCKHYWGVQKTFTDINDDDVPYQGHHDVLIIPSKNQKLTDLSKAIRYCDSQGAKHISIICALGGRLDHHEGAVRSLRSEYKKERPIFLHSEGQTLRYAVNESIVITGEIGEKCGMVAFPKASISSQGLKYEAQNFNLDFGFSENICNELAKEQATVTVKGEALIIMPGQLATQKWFMAMTDAERLAMQLRDAQDISTFLLEKK